MSLLWKETKIESPAKRIQCKSTKVVAVLAVPCSYMNRVSVEVLPALNRLLKLA